MITIEKYSKSKSALWDDFVELSKNGTFMLKRGYVEYHENRFVDNSLMFYKDSKLVAVFPASIHNNEICSHGGLTYGGLVVGRDMTAQLCLSIFEFLREYMCEHNLKSCLYKRVPSIYYTYPADEDLYALFHIGAQLVRRDLSTTIYQQDKICFTERRKRGVKKAIKAGIVVKESKDYDIYISLLSNVLVKYHGTQPVHTAEEMKLLSSRYPENIKLYAAYNENKMLAGVVVFITQKVVHTQYIANSDEGRQCGALDAVMDHLINYVFASKEYFDFGISTENCGQLLNEGLVVQKQEFGGRAIVHDFYKLEI